jgi:hypothetical protein
MNDRRLAMPSFTLPSFTLPSFTLPSFHHAVFSP